MSDFKKASARSSQFKAPKEKTRQAAIPSGRRAETAGWQVAPFLVGLSFSPSGIEKTMLRTSTNISIVAAGLLILLSTAVSNAASVKPPEQTCNSAADAALAAEDYPTAINLHRKFLGPERDNALAHYHLGFSYGMVGLLSEEISEYRKAISLGLRTWDLFLNLGLAYYERHELANATAALETAVSLGPEHAESHFNLAVVYERENRLNQALQEIIAALILAPRDLDAANTDAVICAKMGDLVCARKIWTQLVHAAPGYAPAQANLALLNKSCAGNCDLNTNSQTELLSQFESDE